MHVGCVLMVMMVMIIISHHCMHTIVSSRASLLHAIQFSNLRHQIDVVDGTTTSLIVRSKGDKTLERVGRREATR